MQEFGCFACRELDRRCDIEKHPKLTPQKPDKAGNARFEVRFQVVRGYVISCDQHLRKPCGSVQAPLVFQNSREAPRNIAKPSRSLRRP